MFSQEFAKGGARRRSHIRFARREAQGITEKRKDEEDAKLTPGPAVNGAPNAPLKPQKKDDEDDKGTLPQPTILATVAPGPALTPTPLKGDDDDDDDGNEGKTSTAKPEPTPPTPAAPPPPPPPPSSSAPSKTPPPGPMSTPSPPPKPSVSPIPPNPKGPATGTSTSTVILVTTTTTTITSSTLTTIPPSAVSVQSASQPAAPTTAPQTSTPNSQQTTTSSATAVPVVANTALADSSTPSSTVSPAKGISSGMSPTEGVFVGIGVTAGIIVILLTFFILFKRRRDAARKTDPNFTMATPGQVQAAGYYGGEKDLPEPEAAHSNQNYEQQQSPKNHFVDPTYRGGAVPIVPSKDLNQQHHSSPGNPFADPQLQESIIKYSPSALSNHVDGLNQNKYGQQPSFGGSIPRKAVENVETRPESSSVARDERAKSVVNGPTWRDSVTWVNEQTRRSDGHF
ncbi:hypothetical protein G7Y89_g7283 [Cudoniella acicularis]|uniref:Uncharacterized protein n=1 Tax=Cudoniella acicularis TaxID=354080 RepID=A0A8H4RIW1_9HELO|nr:hypothetical protein G7Y89_g7283 [Cudoniella acicularis]